MDLWKTFAEGLVRWRHALLVVAAMLTLLSIIPASKLQFDQSIESLYAPENPQLQKYLDSKRLFGGDEFIVVAFTDSKLFDSDGRLSSESANRIREFSRQLSAVPGLDSSSTQNLADALTLDRWPLLATQREKLLELVEGLLVGEDRETTAIILRLMPRHEAPVPRHRTIEFVRQKAAEFPFPTYIVGEPVLVHDTFRYVEQDGAVLGWASAGLLTLVIVLIFRRLRWVVLPLLVVQAAILWTNAFLVVSGFQLSMVSSVMKSLMMVVGIATVMHVIVRFREQRSIHDPISAARVTFQELAHPIFWTTATTSAGFAAQLTSHVVPVQSFGLMMGIGTMILLAAAATILPGGMLLGKLEVTTERADRSTGTGKILSLISHWLEHHPKRLALAAILLIVLSLSGMYWLRVETDFSKNFRSSTPIVQALAFAETKLGGAGVWEVSFSAPAEIDNQFQDRVRRLTQQLRDLKIDNRSAVTKVIALSDGTDLIPFLPLPAKRTLLRQMQPEFEDSLFNREKGRMRIVLRARERQQSEERLQAIAEVNRISQAEFPDATTSGLFVLLTYLVDSLSDDQWVSFGVAAGMIIGLMTIAFRSLRIGLVSLIPNVIPIVFVIGAMGWLGIPINIGTAMISSVSMGLTVDSSIHYFSGFRRARAAGLDVMSALRETNQGVGTALIYTNLALIAGSLALCLSLFIPLVYFGLLVSVAMLGGLIGNLLLLPLLIHMLRIE